MKATKILTVFVLLQTLMIIQVYNQTRADILTPKGNNVEAYIINTEYDNYWRNYYDNYYTQAYPNAIKIITYGGYSTTTLFNCHGYAWHVSEGGAYRWIGYFRNTDEDVYWTSGSYVVSAPLNPGGKVSYKSDDHSAIVVGTNWFISKWGNKVLMRHAYNDCPYNSSSLTYYKLDPNMTGSTSLLCYNVERPFNTNITSMPTATLTWTPNAYVIPVSGAGTPTYRVKGSSGNGTGTVSFQITTPSGFTWSSSKSFWVGKPVITNQKVDGNNYYSGIQLCPGNHWLNVTPVGDGAGNATWTVPSGVPYIVGNNTLDFTFPSSFSGMAITARSANTCGTSTNANFYLTKKTSGCTYSYGMTVYPNPASDYVMVMIEDTQPLVENSDSVSVDLAPQNATTIKPAIYTLSIYNSQSMLIYTVTRNDKNFIVPLGSVQDGTYVIKITDGDNCYQQQLIVKRR